MKMKINGLNDQKKRLRREKEKGKRRKDSTKEKQGIIARIYTQEVGGMCGGYMFQNRTSAKKTVQCCARAAQFHLPPMNLACAKMFSRLRLRATFFFSAKRPSYGKTPEIMSIRSGDYLGRRPNDS